MNERIRDLFDRLPDSDYPYSDYDEIRTSAAQDIIALVREDERKRKATRNCHTAKSSTSAQRRPAMYDRHEMHTDVVDAVSAMGWTQTEFAWIADPEEIADAVAPIVWQAALDFIYQQPMTLNRDTLIERMKRWMGADNE